jgi:pimeloyl-ACP methyl ester carboxylesterase
MTSSQNFFLIPAGGHCLRAIWVGEEALAVPVLVFLHEGLGSIPQWRDFPEALCRATGCRGLVYERLGYGGSDPASLPRPDDFLEREAQQHLPEVLDACGIHRPVLVGHSDGGTIALLFASAFPQRPQGVITEAAHVVLDEVTVAGVADVFRRWSDGELRSRLERYHGDNTETMFRGWAETWLRPERRAWSITDRLGAIVCPVLAIQGADDEHGLPAQLDAIADGISGRAERLLVPDCAHVPHHQARPVVLERMTAFLRALRRG